MGQAHDGRCVHCGHRSLTTNADGRCFPCEAYGPSKLDTAIGWGCAGVAVVGAVFAVKVAAVAIWSIFRG